MSQDRSSDTPSGAVYRGAGQGTFVGLLAAALSHWAWGLNLPLLAACYGYGLATLRGWAELAGILTMIGATVLYFAIYDVITLDSAGLGLTIGLSVLAVALFGVYLFTVPALVNRARVRALQGLGTVAVDIERCQHWEEPYFARLRAKVAAGERLAPLFIRPLAWTVLGSVVALLPSIPLVDSPDSRFLARKSLATVIKTVQPPDGQQNSRSPSRTQRDGRGVP